jgi:hypothetical protein
MDRERETPAHVDEVFDYVYDRLADGDAAHLDQELVALGDRAARTADPRALDDADRLVLAAWRHADAPTRHTLAHMAIRVVGHERFATASDHQAPNGG